MEVLHTIDEDGEDGEDEEDGEDGEDEDGEENNEQTCRDFCNHSMTCKEDDALFTLYSISTSYVLSLTIVNIYTYGDSSICSNALGQ